MFLDSYGSVSLTVSNTISSNTAGRSGGGIITTGGTIEATHAVVSGNKAGMDGGGLYCSDTGILRVHSSAITGNEAALSGGGLFSQTCKLQLWGTDISANAVVDTSNQVITMGGGGAFIEASAMFAGIDVDINYGTDIKD